MTNGGGFFGGQVRPTTQVEVLLAVVAKIQENVPAFPDSESCFVSDTPWPGVDIQGNLFCTVAPSDGSFDQGLMDGSGNLGVAELTQIVVTVWSRIEMDQIERFQAGLTDPQRGLLPLKQMILKALAGKNLNGDDPDITEETNEDSVLLLMEALSPSRARHQPQKIDDFASFSLSFDAKFNWDLGSGSALM